MVEGLERRQQEGDLHFVTFSCYHRLRIWRMLPREICSRMRWRRMYRL